MLNQCNIHWLIILRFWEHPPQLFLLLEAEIKSCTIHSNYKKLENISEQCSPVIEKLPCTQTVSAVDLTALMPAIETMIHTGNCGFGIQ